MVLSIKRVFAGRIQGSFVSLGLRPDRNVTDADLLTRSHLEKPFRMQACPVCGKAASTQESRGERQRLP